MAALAAGAFANNIELPVATQGLQQWMGTVAKAVSVGGRSKEEALAALNSFQEAATANLAKHVIACPPARTSCHGMRPVVVSLSHLQSFCLHLHERRKQLPVLP